MNKAKFNKCMKDNPYYQYDTDRTRELLKVFLDKLTSKDKTAWLKFVATLCQRLAINESDIMQNQAVLNDPSPYKNGTRDDLLKMFGKTFIDNTLSDHNQTYADFNKKAYMNGGDNE